MSVFDAYAIIALLLDEPAADLVDRRLRSEGADACVSVVNVAEIIDRLVRIGGRPADQVSDSLDWLTGPGGMVVVPVDQHTGRMAGLLRARHYRRNGSDVSLGDCVALATAIDLRRPLATADPALAALTRKEGVELLALPDSRGRMP